MNTLNLKLFVLLLLLSSSVLAQDQDSVKASHFVGLQTGLNQVKDENLHPKVSAGYESAVVKFFSRLLDTGNEERKFLIQKFGTQLSEAVDGKTSAALPGASELECWIKSKLEEKTMRELLKKKPQSDK